MHVLLIDDHAMFRQGLRFILTDLKEDIRVTEAGNCPDAIAVLDSGPVDLALLDRNMPGSAGLTALRDIRAAHPAVPIAVLSGVDDPDLIRSAIDEGASGFVPKASSSEVLLAALNLILAGGVYLPRAALNSHAAAVAGEDRGA